MVNIFGQQPRFIWVYIDGVEVEIPFEQVQLDHIVVIGAGQMIPVDGVITDGYATIDQQRLTGEAQPVEKTIGDTVLAAQARGMSAAIYRPSRIVANQAQGNINANDALMRIVKGCIQLGIAPIMDEFVDNLVPVDFVSRAIFHLSLQQASLGKAFHLVNPQNITMTEIMRQVEACGYQLAFMPSTAWRVEASRRARLSPDVGLHPFLPLFAVADSAGSPPQVTYSCMNTLAGLQNSSIVCPPIDTDWWQTTLAYLVQTGFLPALDG